MRDDLQRRIRAKWEQESVSLEQIAELTKIPLVNLENWKREEDHITHQPQHTVPNYATFPQLQRLAEYFHLPPDYFINLARTDRNWPPQGTVRFRCICGLWPVMTASPVTASIEPLAYQWHRLHDMSSARAPLLAPGPTRSRFLLNPCYGGYFKGGEPIFN